MSALVESAPAGEETFILPPTIMERLDYPTIFGEARPVELELGAGDGSFLLEYARLNPDRSFVGVERLLGRLRKIDKKARRQELDNIRVLRLEASYVVDWMIPRNSLDAIHVYFPDPWPKRRHWPRRLVNAAFTQLTHKALKAGGVVHLRTDDESYFAQMQEVYEANPLFRREPTPETLLAVKTDFEKDFNAKGIPTRSGSWRSVG
ncbi:MAG TPA: tRNA (guanosine(46)-N7)-methyltransferase TrmB [Candidatus Limnocylindria bacterium]|jgi:tRNA (guanine-N7-)-methyltransferase|nr:tRNA (guanosine(46)-N7)-methyltransferase TrmB [Candidatus Limnocylindria bacterium]